MDIYLEALKRYIIDGSAGLPCPPGVKFEEEWCKSKSNCEDCWYDWVNNEIEKSKNRKEKSNEINE